MVNVAADAPPKYLYKYRKCDKNREGADPFERDRSIIVGNTLWAGSPNSFNDPYDCFPVTDFDATSEEITDWVATVAPDFGMPVDEGMQLIQSALLNPEAVRKMASWRDCLNSIGVVSLTERPDDMLMWAHYADSHRGYCLEFDTNAEPLSLAHRVQYAKERPSYRIFDRDRAEAILQTLLRKADFWEHEREWRLVKPTEWGPIIMPPDSLKSIILGLGFETEDEAALREMVAVRPSPVAIKRAVLNGSSYRIEIIDA